MCPSTGISYDEPAPNLFSFNSPYGACPQCNGLGEISEIDINKIVANPKLSIAKGAIAPVGTMKGSGTWFFKQIEAIGHVYGFSLETPFEDISDEAVNILLYGSDELFKISTEAGNYNTNFEGIATFILRQSEDDPSPGMLRWAQGFTDKKVCPTCNGARLKKEALYFKIADKNIAEVSEMDISVMETWFKNIEKKMSKTQLIIGTEVLKEIRSRIRFLMEVGLDYVTLNRSSKSSIEAVGEAQRIRLATQIGSQLVGVLYIIRWTQHRPSPAPMYAPDRSVEKSHRDVGKQRVGCGAWQGDDDGKWLCHWHWSRSRSAWRKDHSQRHTERHAET